MFLQTGVGVAGGVGWVGVVATGLVFDGGRALVRGVARAMRTLVVRLAELRLVFEVLVVEQTVVICVRFGQRALTRARLSSVACLVQTRRPCPRLSSRSTHLRATPT